MATRQGILLFAHGASDPEWAEPFRNIQRRIRARLPEIPVELAFLERAQPTFAEAADSLAAQGCAKIAVLPLFLARGGHIKNDLPELIRRQTEKHPGLTIEAFQALGEIDDVIEAIACCLVSLYLAKEAPTPCPTR
jgi:sirohydrochlorin cobaltochelatase